MTSGLWFFGVSRLAGMSSQWARRGGGCAGGAAGVEAGERAVPPHPASDYLSAPAGLLCTCRARGGGRYGRHNSTLAPSTPTRRLTSDGGSSGAGRWANTAGGSLGGGLRVNPGRPAALTGDMARPGRRGAAGWPCYTGDGPITGAAV